MAVRLKPIAQIPNTKALAWHQGYLYVSQGYRLYRIKEELIETGNLRLEFVGSFSPDPIRGVAVKSRLLTRLFRAGFHTIRFLNNRIIGIVAKHIVVLDGDSKEFRSTFQIKRGTRPLGMAVTPDGKIFWGEYFSNPNRDEVYVYGSEDGGDSWDVVYSFPPGEIRHIHNIYYDRYEECLWILTGDSDKESKIIKTNSKFTTLTEILSGSQQARAGSIIACKDYIYFATDAPHDENAIYRITRECGANERLCSIAGPSIWATKTNRTLFISTQCEPAEHYSGLVHLYSSNDGENWQSILTLTKDRLPFIFGYGTIIFPFYNDEVRKLAISGMAVKEMDGVTLVYQIDYE